MHRNFFSGLRLGFGLQGLRLSLSLSTTIERLYFGRGKLETEPA